MCSQIILIYMEVNNEVKSDNIEKKIDKVIQAEEDRWFNITNITPPSPDDGSQEPKRYSVDFVSQWISSSAWITLLSIFSQFNTYV